MKDYKVVEIDNCNISLLQNLADESITEGHLFIQKTIEEWRNGTNTFSNAGEKLWGLFIGSDLIGIGGLNQDSYINDASIGRVRHVYTAKEYRGLGLSKIILNLVIETAKNHFKTLWLIPEETTLAP